MSQPASRHEDHRVRRAPQAGAFDPAIAYFELTDTSVVPAKWRDESNFTITRLRSSIGLANRIMKESSVAALLVSVSVRSIPLGRYRGLGGL